MSLASRKCGVHMLQPPAIITSPSPVTTTPTTTTFPTTPLCTFEEDIDVMALTHHRSVGGYESVVESFLDENSDFLEDYVRRKVNRIKLENWLFRRHSTSSSKQFLTVERNSTNQLSTYVEPRQRSRSFTPLRKLSATKFEENGLSTPILSKTVDGQPTFLRTQPPPHLNDTMTVSFEHSDRNDRNLSRKLIDRRELLLKLFPDIISCHDVTIWCYKAARILNRLFHVDRAEIFILNRPNSFDGDLYFMELGNDKLTKVSSSANRLVTGALTSGRIINVEKPDVDFDNFQAMAGLVGPLLCARGQRVIGSVHLYRKSSVDNKSLFEQDENESSTIYIDRKCSNEHQTSTLNKFLREDEIIFGHFLELAGRSLSSVLSQQEMRLELSRSEVFLELARTVFREPSRLEPTMLTILTNFLSLIDCERCQILLSDPGHPNVFKRVFDLERKDLNVDGSCDRDSPFEARFPINALITGEVARTGQKVSLKFDPANGDPTSPRSIICLPIRDPDQKVLGVISLIDKEDGGEFTDNDARFAEAFSIFCGMAIRNAADYEKAVVSEAKLQVAFEVMNRFMTATESDADELANLPVAAASSLTIDTFTFNYLDMDDNGTLTATIRMFIDLGLLSRFSIDYLTLCRFLLTVKRNYRNETVMYHNWYHAFNVAQVMFAMLLKTGWNKMFSETDVLGVLVACICHDLDHRGTNNSFQIKTKNPLAKLYSSSTMERHHLNQCLLLLNLKGNNILEHLNQSQYTSTLTVIENCILATDLSLHFRHLSAITALANNVVTTETTTNLDSLVGGHDTTSSHNRFLLQSAMMTAADLGAVTKPWVVHRAVSQLLAEEFWAQGDLERKELNEAPQPMMDREASLNAVQLGFIDGVCVDVYQIMARFSPDLEPLLEACLANRAQWLELEREEQAQHEERQQQLQQQQDQLHEEEEEQVQVEKARNL